MEINREVLRRLIEFNKESPEMLEAVRDALSSFEDYHAAIYDMETRKRILYGTVNPAEYQLSVSEMDRRRTGRHNVVLANVSMLNRMAEMAGLPPVYDGTVSEEQPYRREVADAVLAFVREIILERP